jgi:chemotaxis protein MotB
MTVQPRGRGHARRRGGPAEEHVNHERWMVTYADMLTLLLVLFIVLYAISQVNTSKFAELKSGLASAFKNGQPSVLTAGSGIVGGEAQTAQQAIGPTPPVVNVARPAADQNSQAQAAAREVDEFKKIEQAIKDSLAARGLAGSAMFNIDERGLVITVVTNELVFAGNSAELERQGGRILEAVAVPLRSIDNQLQVDGHTNQQNVSTAPYPSGWELSSARASSVVRYLVGHEAIAANRLSAVGYSDQRPLIDPKDPRSITRNRRVDIVVLSKLSAVGRSLLASAATGSGD